MELGFWIVISGGILDSLSCIPNSKAQDSGSATSKIFSDSGIQMQNPDSVCVWSRKLHEDELLWVLVECIILQKWITLDRLCYSHLLFFSPNYFVSGH